MDMESATEVLLVVHENGSYVGWKSFSKMDLGLCIVIWKLVVIIFVGF